VSAKATLTIKTESVETIIYPEMDGPIGTHLTPGSAITVRDLLHMMLTVSDNNATDILIRLGGGIATVDARMRALGVSGIRVDRYIWELLANYFGNLDASAQNPLSPADYGHLGSATRSEADRRHYRQLYSADPATPVRRRPWRRCSNWSGKARRSNPKPLPYSSRSCWTVIPARTG
jgi:beta-lactamase class A